VNAAIAAAPAVPVACRNERREIMMPLDQEVFTSYF